MMRLVLMCVLASVAIAPVTQAQDLRPAPDYFVEAILATGIAKMLAEDCDMVRIDPNAQKIELAKLNRRLEADGFSRENAFKQMQSFGAQQIAMKYEWEDRIAPVGAAALLSGEDPTCAVAFHEIAENTSAGSVLVEVAQ